MKKKKLQCSVPTFLLAGVLCLTLAACGAKQSSDMLASDTDSAASAALPVKAMNAKHVDENPYMAKSDANIHHDGYNTDSTDEILPLGNFEKANALSANNKTIKNNLGAVELINGNVKEAEVLFGAATGAGNEVNYNKGIVAIMKGDYKAAVDYFGKCNCVNAALANILAGNNNEAAKKLNEGKDDSALASYLKAVIAARNNDNSAVLSNLKTACSKDASMKKLAATDMEFAKLFDNADFQAIVK